MTAGVVLAGGASRRMGRDKALVEVDGRAMARRVADALAAAGCDPVWCQGGDVDQLRAVSLTVRPDPHPGCGPLAAILSAVESLGPHESKAVVAACDLAWLDAVTVARLLAVAERDPSRVVVASDPQGTHLLAVWPRTAIAALRTALEGGTYSYRGALAELGAHEVAVDSQAIRNVNSPHDLAPGVGRDG